MRPSRVVFFCSLGTLCVTLVYCGCLEKTGCKKVCINMTQLNEHSSSFSQTFSHGGYCSSTFCVTIQLKATEHYLTFLRCTRCV